ncbi:ABC-type transporter, integral membrane subunit [Thalassoporum mexicanum PCC 7367]|uniref:branched-chain amino acid ABC transporter permease n=1 Tax=Thalassoporum mexicanum TaxID=3457544 RepID=UPI00029FCF85|nr:branched-chain amino acid ABC transporter permease [Pseudanabaena sp. PCC 7367]AFY70911.1 ABC-type transporter, integral membrane subunit [Pseudanabaena sp. PCC 7367]
MLAYLTSLLSFASIFALFSLGLNLQWGFAGLVNFGHVAFMTVGAYTTVMLNLAGVPWYFAFLLAAIAAGILGLLVGSTTLRLRTDYLAIVTIGVSEIVRLIANNEEWLTNGARGVYGYDRPLEGLVATNYYPALLMGLLLVVLAVVYWQLERLVRSPWGRVLKAIREDEEVAKALGKNVFWYKLQAFSIGAAIAGFAGAFFAWQLTTVYPETFIPLITFQAWTIVTIGGAGSNLGVLLGALIFQLYNTLPRFLPQQVRIGILGGGKLEALQLITIGLTLILLMVWRPQGIMGNKDELTLTK